MTIESEIAGLTQATTDLLNAVNISKTTLDEKVSTAITKASDAAICAEATAADAIATAEDRAAIALDKAAVVAQSPVANAADANASKISAAASAATAMTKAETATTKAAEASASAASAVNAPGTNGTSITSLTIGTGSKNLTTQTGKNFAIGQRVIVARTAAPDTTWMYGVVSAYTSGTGAMTVSVSTATGTGTFTDWTIGLTGPISGVEQSDIGTEPNQIPLNQYLGDLAFQSADSLIIRPPTDSTPHLPGSMTFQLTNNTTLSVKVKGSDGVVRTATLTLA